MPLQQKLEYLFSLRTGSKINWNSEGYLRLLKSLGDPHLNLPPVIHVAGTNGKGSVVAVLQAILQASERKVHTYTSPHLIKVNERIVLAGREIEDEHLESLIDGVMPFCQGTDLSFFEIMTAIAFKSFSQIAADVLILEVGVGGLLDCTNVVEKPLVCVINRISKDHTEFLGGDLASIATQKAGIMKQGVPCVAGYQGESAQEIVGALEYAAQKTNSPLLVHGRDWYAENKDNGFDFTFLGLNHSFSGHFPMPSLVGQHQIWNAGAALAALCVIEKDFPVSIDDMHKGLQHIQWRGRLQELNSNDFGLPAHVGLWLDCGHNDSAGEVLALQMRQWKQQDAKNLHLVVGMLGKKKAEDFLLPIVQYADTVHTISISHEPTAHDPEHLGSILSGIFPQEKIHVHRDFTEALAFFRMNQVRQARILVAGSVYLAGEVLQFCNKRPNQTNPLK